MLNNHVILRGHHLPILYQHYIIGFSLEELKYTFTDVYDLNLATRVINTLSKITNGSTIILIDNLDDICSKKCIDYDTDCENPNSSLAREDRMCIELYNLILKKPYSIKEILKKFKETDSSLMFK